MSLSDSIKAKLKNRAIKEHRTFQEILTVYGLERALYRLSISPFSNNFILKGGILLYAMFEGKYSRGTADVDLLGQQISNDLDHIKETFVSIFEIPFPDDAIEFDLSTLNVTRITEFKKYPGLNVSITAYLDRTRIPVQIDIGFGDVVYPEIESMEYPTLLDHPAAIIQVYSKESIIAEKFEAIVSLGNATSRMKDFYDIYVLSKTYNFRSDILSEAISETFQNRNTSLDLIVAFEVDFTTDSNRQRMWKSFLKSKKIEQNIEFKVVVNQIQMFLGPIINNAKKVKSSQREWNFDRNKWI